MGGKVFEGESMENALGFFEQELKLNDESRHYLEERLAVIERPPDFPDDEGGSSKVREPRNPKPRAPMSGAVAIEPVHEDH
jgi:hypothetical protein